jgi:methyltransferase (TIGR00027 family)
VEISIWTNLAAAVAFRIIQLLFLPIAVVAYVIFVFKLIAYSRRSRASATALASFYTRWMQHKLGTRRDEPCVRIMDVLPNVSPLGLRLVTAPTLVAHSLTGFVPKIYRYPYEGVPPMSHQPAARTTFYDAALKRYLPGVEQLVLLGAGLDTRSYRLPSDARVRCFEVDTPGTQAFKLEMLKKAGIDTSRVTYVPADFLKDDWYEKLLAGGFDRDKPTLFLWESVTMYLDQSAVERTLRKIAGTAPGSVVAFDYFSTELIHSRMPFWLYAKAVLNAIGEPMGTFGIDNTPPVRAQVTGFVRSCGLSLEEQRNFGEETANKRAAAGFAVAIVPTAANR